MSIAPIKSKANCAGNLNLTIAPITGVVQPINNINENAKIRSPKIIPFEFESIFLLKTKESRMNSEISHASNIAGYFKKLPLSKGKGLKRTLIIASGIFLISCMNELSILVVFM